VLIFFICKYNIENNSNKKNLVVAVFLHVCVYARMRVCVHVYKVLLLLKNHNFLLILLGPSIFNFELFSQFFNFIPQ